MANASAAFSSAHQALTDGSVNVSWVPAREALKRIQRDFNVDSQDESDFIITRAGNLRGSVVHELNIINARLMASDLNAPSKRHRNFVSNLKDWMDLLSDDEQSAIAKAYPSTLGRYLGEANTQQVSITMPDGVAAPRVSGVRVNVTAAADPDPIDRPHRDSPLNNALKLRVGARSPRAVLIRNMVLRGVRERIRENLVQGQGGPEDGPA